MNATELAQVLTVLESAYPSANVKPDTAKVWAELLVGVDPRDGLAAAKSLMLTSKFFPSISEFVEASRSALRVRTANSEGYERVEAVAELPPAYGSRSHAEQLAQIRQWREEFDKRDRRMLGGA